MLIFPVPNPIDWDCTIRVLYNTAHMSNGHADSIANPIELILTAGETLYRDSVDGTMGIEEEFAICDPETLDLVPRFADVERTAQAAGLEKAVCGELLASEVEFRTGRNETFADAVGEITQIRRQVSELFTGMNLLCATSGTHPWADYREQPKIDMPYYNRLVERMAWATDRNNTFGLHVHVGVRGTERAVAVADAIRPYIPLLLALSASSPFIDGQNSGMSSTRSMTFSRIFPRANIPPVFSTWNAYADYVRMLRDTRSIETYGQMWWGVRLHAVYGTVEFRMFDGQPDIEATAALAAAARGLTLLLCAKYDAGELPAGGIPTHLIEENSWRASRWGLEAELIDFVEDGNGGWRAGGVHGVSSLTKKLVADIGTVDSPQAHELTEALQRLISIAEQGNSSAHQQKSAAQGMSLHEIYRGVVTSTMTVPVAAIRTGS